MVGVFPNGLFQYLITFSIIILRYALILLLICIIFNLFMHFVFGKKILTNKFAIMILYDIIIMFILYNVYSFLCYLKLHNLFSCIIGFGIFVILFNKINQKSIK